MPQGSRPGRRVVSPPPPALARARHAWSEGRFGDVLAALEDIGPLRGAERFDATALRVRALLRGNGTAAALPLAAALATLAGNADERVTAAFLHADALRRAGKHTAALAALARADGERGLHRAVRAELAYQRGLVAWSAGDAVEAARIAGEAFTSAPEGARALLEVLLGWCAISQERYADAAHRFEAALAAERSAPTRDLHLVATTLVPLALRAANAVDLALGERLELPARELPAVPELAYERATVFELLGIVARLRGDVVAAWNWFTDARAAGDAVAAIGADVQLALLSRAGGDRFLPQVVLRDACARAAALDWRRADADRRSVLPDLAAAAASVDADAAERVLDTYRALHLPGRGTKAHDRDRRPAAYESLAAARIAEARGAQVRARDLYASAFAVFEEIGYRRKAAEVALDLHRVSGDEHARARAEVLTRAAPASWLYADARARRSALSKTEYRVMLAICSGRSALEIAESFGRSRNTINNHTKRIFKVMGVRTRSALVAECARQGILPEA